MSRNRRPLSEIYLELGEALLEANRPDEALEASRRARKEDAVSPRIVSLVIPLEAQAYEMQKEYSRAFESYIEALDYPSKDYPSNDPKSILEKMHDLLTRDHSAGEKAAFPKWATGDEDSRFSDEDRVSLMLLRGRINLYARQAAKAIEIFQQAKKLAPNDTRIVEGLGQALWMSSRNQESLETLKEAYNLAMQGYYEERWAIIQAKRARVLASLGRYRSALKLIAERLDEADDYSYDMALTRGRCFLAIGQLRDALKAANDAFSERPGESAPALLQAKAWILLKNYGEAYLAASGAERRNPSEEATLLESEFWMARAYIEGQMDVINPLGRLNDYIHTVQETLVKGGRPVTRKVLETQVFLPATKVLDRDGDFHYFLARLHDSFGNTDKALKEVELALELGLSERLPFGEAPAYKLKADLLVQKNGNAGIWFCKAGQCYLQQDKSAQIISRQDAYRLASEQFEIADNHGFKDAAIYWHWSECLLRQSLAQNSLNYPYINAHNLDRSLEKWDHQYPLGAPMEEFAWAYLVRAICLEAKSVLEFKQLDLWYEAIVNIEKNLVFDPNNAVLWACLGRYYRLVRMDTSAWMATEEALRLNVNALTLYERASVLAEIGDEKAIDAIDLYQREISQNSSRAHALKAISLCLNEEFGEAIALLDSAIEREQSMQEEEIARLIDPTLKAFHQEEEIDRLVDPTSKAFHTELYYRSLRARAYRLSGQTKKAGEDYKWICNIIRDSGTAVYDHNNLKIQVQAGYGLNLYPETLTWIDVLKGHVDRTGVDPFTPLIYFALCRLNLLGHLQASNDFKEAMKYVRNRRQVIETLQELSEIENQLPDDTRSEATLQEIQKLKQLIKRKGDSYKNKEFNDKSVISELKGKEPGPDFTASWLALHSGLGRMYIKTGQWEEAIKVYTLLQSQQGYFPESRFALATILDNLQLEADKLLKESSPERARRQYSANLEKLKKYLPEDKERLAGAFGRLGYAYFRLSDKEKAKKYFFESLSSFSEHGCDDPGGSLGMVCSRLLHDAADYWALESEWSDLEHQPTLDESLSKKIGAARRTLFAFLDRLYQLDAVNPDGRFSTHLDQIQVEMGSKVVSSVGIENSPLSKTYIPAMQDRIEVHTNVRVPPPSILENPQLAPNEYVFKLNGVPVEAGALPAGGRPSYTDAMLELIGSRTRDVEIPDPSAFIAYHLESVLRRHLAEFMGLQEVQDLFEKRQREIKRPSLIETAPGDEVLRLRLARVLRALVKERVPITNLGLIIAAFQEMKTKEIPVDDAVRSIRLQLKKELPGNSADASRIKVPPYLEGKILREESVVDGKPYFFIPRDTEPEMLSNLKQILALKSPQAQMGNNSVLVVHNPELRLPMRRLIESRFPDVMVLSQEELLP